MLESREFIFVVIAVIFLAVGVQISLWIFFNRPAWGDVKDAIYYFLCATGLAIAWVALIHLSGWNLVIAVLSSAAVIYLNYLALKKFNQL